MGKLDQLVEQLKPQVTEKQVFKTISMRIPIAILAAVDALSIFKEGSRNEVLNELLSGALEDVADKLQDVDPDLLKQYQLQAKSIEKELGSEQDHPPKKRGPKHHKKH